MLETASRVGNRATRALLHRRPGVVHTTVRSDSVQRVDTVLGAGAYAEITSVMNPRSPYTGNPYLRGHATALTTAGLAVNDAKRLMRGMGRVITSQGKYTRCAQQAAAMATGAYRMRSSHRSSSTMP